MSRSSNQCYRASGEYLQIENKIIKDSLETDEYYKQENIRLRESYNKKTRNPSFSRQTRKKE